MTRAAGPDPLMLLVPCFNEERSISRVVREIHEVLPGVPVLVVDDGSQDATADVARDAGAHVLSLPIHLGLGACVQAGYKMAFDMGFEYVIRLDGDGQHDPHYVPDLFATLKQTGCQMVIGSRFVDDQGQRTSAVRTLGIRFFRTVLRPILGRPVHDPTSGFVGVNRAALALFRRSFPLEYPEIEALVVLQRRAFRFEEVPVRMRPRIAGRSTITPVKSIYYILHVLLGVFVNILKYDRGRRPR